MSAKRSSRAGRAVRRALQPFAAPLAARRMRALRDRCGTLDDALDAAYGFEFLGARIAPWQLRSEIRDLLARAQAEPPRVVVEIGTAAGGALFLFARVAAPDALLVSVDLPHGEFGGGYPRWRAPLYRAFAGPGQRIELIRGDSHRSPTLERVRELTGGRAVDLLFIDGDHSYEGVRRDFEMYRELVRPGGLIGLHDIVPQGDAPRGPREVEAGAEYCVGSVPAFWHELQGACETEELVEDWRQGSFGIGVVRVPAGAGVALPAGA